MIPLPHPPTHTSTPSRAIRRITSALLVGSAVLLGACSSDTVVNTRDGDPIEGTVPGSTPAINDPATGVENGTEGGIELDNGNVPGSENDQDLDEVTDG